MRETILILGGTHEAVSIANELAGAKPQARIITSLAGRTREPRIPSGETRIGGFGGVDGLNAYLKQEGITSIIDATHPFATRISNNARLSAQICGIPLETRIRPPWRQNQEDIWLHVHSIGEAVSTIPSGARVLLALGSKHIEPFSKRPDVFLLVRMVDAPSAPLSLPDHQLLPGKPSADWQREAETLQQNAISHIVCRNSGGTTAYAKIKAARHLQLPVIMIARPV